MGDFCIRAGNSGRMELRRVLRTSGRAELLKRLRALKATSNRSEMASGYGSIPRRATNDVARSNGVARATRLFERLGNEILRLRQRATEFSPGVRVPYLRLGRQMKVKRTHILVSLAALAVCIAVILTVAGRRASASQSARSRRATSRGRSSRTQSDFEFASLLGRVPTERPVARQGT